MSWLSRGLLPSAVLQTVASSANFGMDNRGGDGVASLMQ